MPTPRRAVAGSEKKMTTVPGVGTGMRYRALARQAHSIFRSSSLTNLP